ncbi:MAG TPA: PSD1 and planctomycete cytochrome C domain-containing protein [Phycisphaerales bacterium]|nr:PSD1 and planctomycete cytochrome C domain-containing protein [Phycisphaerales bacterium]
MALLGVGGPGGGTAAVVLVAAAGPGARVAGVDFNRDVRPILSDACFKCHGPDEAAREGGLRLDTREGAVAARERGAAVVPGESGASLLMRMVTASDPAERMPPADSGKTLTPGQIETLRAWVEQGAEYSRHWAFVAPVRPAVPRADGGAFEGWARTPIDGFIAARLSEAGLSPSPEADRRTLIRRASLDVTGLPPTPEEVEAFVADDSSDAWERVVDRLLASPRYGERMALEWLDAARYADSNGYHIDNERHMWRWREWVIGAFNRNVPFDRFTVEQIAGDLLPGATVEQRIASGFNRNHMINFEGGAIAEEYLNEYVTDRANTTATVWLGLTMACAQCHDHKYDPITQRDFYRFYAFFNTVAEQGIDGREGNAAPTIMAPDPGQEAALAAVRASIERQAARVEGPLPEVDAAQAEWERSLAGELAGRWRWLTPERAESSGGSTLGVLEDGSVLASGVNPDVDVYEVEAVVGAGRVGALRLDALTHESLPHGGAGRAYNANFVLTGFEVEAAPAKGGAFEPVAFAAARADHEQATFPVRNAIDGDPGSGWAVTGYERREDRTAEFVPTEPVGFEGGTRVRVRLRFESKFTQHAIGRFRLAVSMDEGYASVARPAALGPWSLAGPFAAESADAAYGTAFGPEAGEDVAWVERADLADGAIHELTGMNAATYLRRTVHSPTARSLRVSLGSDDAIKVWLNGAQVHANAAARSVAPDQDFVDLALREGENELLLKVVNYAGGYAFYFDPRGEDGDAAPLPVALAAERAEGERTEAQRALLRDHFRATRSPEWLAMKATLEDMRAEERALLAAIPTVMVMQEMEGPTRETRLLARGSYEHPVGDALAPGVPEFLGRLPDGAAADRLALAEWLVGPENPLTARVFVNRVWQMLFGAGLVRTSEDFGAQSEWPSHPELLDWLAVEFVESGWDVKGLMRLILVSSAYRQSSRATADRLETDPDNRLVSRGPRFRLGAEAVRDTALAASGLLVERIGGPGVFPYQPPDVWKDVAYDPFGQEFKGQVYVQSTGDDLYRRSMYSYRKRTAPHPAMAVFDAPNFETCVVRRGRTNTPLQALNLMNDPTYVEAARSLAERAMRAEGGAEGRLAFIFARTLSRAPTAAEAGVLLGAYERELASFRADGAAAEALVSVGASGRDTMLDGAEHAAWTMVCTTVMNLDEFITKN